MAIKEYKYNCKTQLSKHFNVQDFKCKCGKKHSIYIDSNLIDVLENVYFISGADKCKVVSGYRCPAHNKAVGSGNTTKNYSHSGYAADIDYFIKDKKINSKTIAINLEDIGHKKGIGYRCGGSETRTHIDVKPRKWYGDEKKSNTKSIGSSFHTYLKVPKTPNYEFELLKDKCFRKQPKVTSTNKITKIKKGVKFKSNDNKIYLDNKKNKWIYTTLNKKSGYICVDDSTGVQAKKI